MRRRRVYGALFPAVLVALPAIAVAIDTSGVPRSVSGLYRVICEISNWFFAFVMVIAVIIFLRGAVEFFFSEGNEQRVSHAKQLFLYAVIGTAIAVLSKGLVIIIGNFLGVTVTFTGACA